MMSVQARLVSCILLILAPISSWAQDGFERLSIDTIEWNGHRFELAVVRELKEPLGYGVKQLVNRKGEVVAVFEPGKMLMTNIYGPGRLIVAGDTIKTTGNRFAQLAKNDSTIIMFSWGRGSGPIQVYNRHNGLKTINSDLSAVLYSPFYLQETDGIYGFGQVRSNECVAVKYTFSGDLVWKAVMNNCLRHVGMKGMFRREDRNIVFSASNNVVGGLNNSVVYVLLDAENGGMRCSWTRSYSNPGLGEFKSFVGDDGFICLLGKEWVLYSLKGKCREIKRGKLLTDRFVHGGVGSFKSGRIIGWAHNLTSQIQFIDLRTNKTETVSIDGMKFGRGSRYIEENTILYKSLSFDKPDLMIRLIE